MKKTLIFMMLCFIGIIASCSKGLSDNSKIDSLFYYHLNKSKELNQAKSIKFMEEITKIKSNAEGDWHGMNSASNEEIKLWEDWYIKNRGTLKWDTINKRAERLEK